MIKCGECGYENTDGLDYCDGCGAKLNPAAAAGDSAAAASPPPASETVAPPPAPDGAEKPAAAETQPAEPAPAPKEEAVPVAGGAPFKAKLTIVRGGRQGHEFPLESGNNLVGRWDPETGAFPEVDLEADDPEAKISRKHALIRIEDGKITVEDVGSLNGTYVNRGSRLQPGSPVELSDGSEIIIGKTFLKLKIEPIS